jgi:hypothetical protein
MGFCEKGALVHRIIPMRILAVLFATNALMKARTAVHAMDDLEAMHSWRSHQSPGDADSAVRDAHFRDSDIDRRRALSIYLVPRLKCSITPIYLVPA